MKFEIGEIAIIKNSVRGLDGRECEILSSLSPLRTVDDFKVKPRHIVQIQGISYKTVSEPCDLRKKKPPEEIDWVKMCNLDKLPEIA